MATITKSISGAAAWVTVTAYSVGARRKNDTAPVKVYQCTTAGTSGVTGPTGTGTGIGDGTCVWSYKWDADYATVQAWEDAIPASMGSDSYTGVVDASVEFSTTGTLCTFAGSTTGASNTILLTTQTGESFRDNANAQTNALRYNFSNGAAMKGNTSGYARTVVISEDYVTLRGLQIRDGSAGGAAGAKVVDVTTTSATHGVIEDCIIEGNLTTQNGVGIVLLTSGTMRQCLVVQRNTNAGRGMSVGYPAANTLIVGCTIVRPSDLTAATDGIEALSGTTTTVTNCAIFGFTNAVNNSARFTGSNNSSDVAIGFGTSNQASKTYGNQFVVTTDAARDFRVKDNSANLYDTGVTDTTNGTPDIVGTARPQGAAYDIGCWELVVAAGGWGGLLDFQRDRLVQA